MMDAISPLDGRYHALLAPVRQHFSEFALMRARVQVEVAHALALDPVFGQATEAVKNHARQTASQFSAEDFLAIRRIESEIRHDVKAVEVFLRLRLGFVNPNRIHFGLTSEDVNNLAWSICARDYVQTAQLPLWRALLADLVALAERWQDAPLPARTHGQHATPTTAGKELAVFISRLLTPMQALRTLRLRGKLNGATGNYSAMLVAAPDIDWRAYERQFVQSLGFDVNLATTQIEDCASFAEYFHVVNCANQVLLDLAQDVWLYISFGYLVQKPQPGEVGSSTMPHKINPIRFENAEGNLQLSNALLVFLADKLSRSRMQRDLSGSTVMRNIGVAIGHHHMAVQELRKGLAAIDLDRQACLRELAAHPELLAEPVQSVLRTVRPDDVYTELKHLTRGTTFSERDLAHMIGDLPNAAAERLHGLTPQSYLGDAERVCREVLSAARAELATSELLP